MYDEAKVTELQREFALAEQDVRDDMPDIEAGFEVDLAIGVAGLSSADHESIAEFFRREFGYVPTYLGLEA